MPRSGERSWATTSSAPARPDEVKKMEALVTQGMREGAFALSSGLEYEVGSYSELKK